MKKLQAKRVLAFVLSLLMLINLCIPMNVQAAEEITQQTVKEVEIRVNESIKLTASGWSFMTTWESSDSDIVTVTNKGVITGMAEGTATVTVTSKGFFFGNRKTEYRVHVIGEAVPEIPETEAPETDASETEAPSDAIQIKIGETAALTAPEGTTTWSTSDSSVAKVSSDGIVTGIAEGTAVITATTKTGGYKFWFFQWGSKTVTTTYTVKVDEGEVEEPETEAPETEAPETETPETEAPETEAPETEAPETEAPETEAPETEAPETEAPETEAPETEASSFKVIFDSNGGSPVESQTIPKGEYATKPLKPLKDGNEFIDWYVTPDFTNIYEFENTPVNSDITLYARWVNIEDKTDTDRDGLSDALEEFSGTDPNKIDTDGDGLSDYEEIVIFAYDPLNRDSDNNGITDDKEDFDSDSLTNIEEFTLGTNPVFADSDNDELTDYEEINIYKTSPVKSDTDGDGVSDGKEIQFGTDPLVAEESFIVNITAEDTDSAVVPSVDIELSGSQAESLAIDEVNNQALFPETIPGYLGSAYEFNVDGHFESATIHFSFDATLLNTEEFDPVIYYFNEEEQQLEALETSVTGNVASATVTHFSTYILINRKVFDEAFTWQDTLSNDESYSGAEIVFVIDDSGSLGGDYGYDSSTGTFVGGNDPEHKRLEVARTFVDNSSNKTKIGIIKFDGVVDRFTSNLVQCDDTGKEELKNLLQFTYVSAGEYNLSGVFDSRGGTYMYTGIEESFQLLSEEEKNDTSIMKAVIVFSDGQASDRNKHSNVIKTATENNIKIYTVGLGNSTAYFDDYLKPLAVNTGGEFYTAFDADQLGDIFDSISNNIDLNLRSDDDGIPDYYEDNMVLFNGVHLELDKNNPDTDGDSIADGDEVKLHYEYNSDKTQVKVTGVMVSDPTKADSDADGFEDTVDKTPIHPIYFKDFDHYKRYAYKDKTIATIFVDQPYKNSRQVINSDDNEEYVGHTFVGIDYNTTGEEYAGFWPYARDKTGEVKGYGTMRAIFRASVDGLIRMQNEAYMTFGNDKENQHYTDLKNINEKKHKWDVAKVFEISNSKVGEIKSFAKNYRYQYNMVSKNCTTFAVEALKKLGIEPKIYEHRWLYDATENLLNYVAYTYKGYSPADAGEDIRINYSNYLIYTKTELKNGEKVDAIFPMKK